MPCYDPETSNRPERLQKIVNRQTRLLCGLCRRSSEEAINADPDLREWWIAHKAHDERIARLKERREAGRPLTVQEQADLHRADNPYD